MIKTFFLKKSKRRRRRGRKRRKAFAFVLAVRIFLGGPELASSNSKTFQSGVNSKTEISRTLDQESSMIADFNQEGSTQPERVLEGLDTPSGKITLGLPRGGDSSRPSKFGPGSKAKGAAKRDFARRRNKLTSGRSSGSLFAESFSPKPLYGSRPAAANHLAQQFQPGQAEGGNGLFGRFSARPTLDPYNPGCAGGPRSIIVLSSQDNPSSSAELTVEDLDKKWEKLSSEEKYDSIRKSKTDVDAIAKNTGYKRKNVQNCKNHLFYDIHRLDRYESLGEPVEIKQFDANENQARAWKRLEKGTHTRQDLTWLKHEKAEQW